jgi:hypothetical protein
MKNLTDQRRQRVAFRFRNAQFLKIAEARGNNTSRSGLLKTVGGDTMKALAFGLAVLMSFSSAGLVDAKAVHRWSFDADASDSVGDADGNLKEGAVVKDGRLELNGETAYVELPIGGTIAGLSNATIEGWVNWKEYLDPWARIFDFGQGQNASLYVTTRNGRADQGSAADTPRFVITNSGFQSEEQINAPDKFPINKETHVAVTIDGEKGVAKLYLDGKLVATKEGLKLKPSDLGNTPNNWLGASQYEETDPLFYGTISEFRIYDTALGDDEITNSFQRGPDELEASQ